MATQFMTHFNCRYQSACVTSITLLAMCNSNFSKRLLLSCQDCMQVLGHSKTMLVLLGGWAFLGDHVSLKQLAGMSLAVIGMVLYGVASSQ